ncbi:hypothetical protein ACVQ92_09130 [Staphylococcus aureus]
MTFSVEKNTVVKVEGISKEQVGALASNIRSVNTFRTLQR